VKLKGLILTNKERDKIMKLGIWLLLKVMYKQLIRPILFAAIDDPDKKWDDFLMARLDDIFDYVED